jgi:hypothetical protein
MKKVIFVLALSGLVSFSSFAATSVSNATEYVKNEGKKKKKGGKKDGCCASEKKENCTTEKKSCGTKAE